MVLEKDRGEEWCDLASGGASWEDGGLSLAAGWLRCRIGTGLVMEHTGGWGTGAGIEAKPPGRDPILQPAASPGVSDALPLTGAGAVLPAGCFRITALAASSRIDPSGDGLHRTDPEMDARRSALEHLGCLRVESGALAVTAAAACGTERWSRVGADAAASLGGTVLTAEAAIGFDPSPSAAFWACASEEGETHRFCAGLFGMPPDFPSARSRMPFGRACGIGAGTALRLRPGGSWSAELACSAAMDDDGESAGLDATFEKRLLAGLEASARGSADFADDGDRARGVLSTRWRPAEGVRAVWTVQATFADGVDPGSETGEAVEARLEFSPLEAMELRIAAAGFSTGGYASRVWCGELSLPGDFASAELWGEGFLLQAAVSAGPFGGLSAGARVSLLEKPGEDSMGEGGEETGGPSRTDISVQVGFSP